jgi:aryl-alcohol dehydrogenase (NADP+)
MLTWQFAKAVYISEMKGYEKFVSMQIKYNLLYREEEREMIPFCKDQDIGILSYNPTAVGILSGKYLKEGKIVISETDIKRLQPDSPLASVYYKVYVEPPENAEIVKRVLEIAQNKGVKPVQIALAWLLHKGVVAPIVGTTKPEHIHEAVEAVGVKLSDREIRYLEEPYKPKPVALAPTSC